MNTQRRKGQTESAKETSSRKELSFIKQTKIIRNELP